MPRSLSFETQIDNSFEDFLKLHFKYEFSHSWNRIQEQVSHPSRPLLIQKILILLRSFSVVEWTVSPTLDEAPEPFLGLVVRVRKIHTRLDVHNSISEDA